MIAFFLLSALSIASISAMPKATPFDNIKRYSVSGTLSLPYAEITGKFFFICNQKRSIICIGFQIKSHSEFGTMLSNQLQELTIMMVGFFEFYAEKNFYLIRLIYFLLSE